MPSIDELAAKWLALENARHIAEKELRYVEKDIAAAMAEDRAEQWANGSLKVAYTSGIEWDKARLDTLREYLSPDEVDALLTAQKPAPLRTWNMTKIKPLLKRGGDVRTIIEAAEMPTKPTLKIKRTAPREV